MSAAVNLYIQEGDTLDYTNDGSANIYGQVVDLSTMIGICASDIAASAVGAISVTGVWQLPAETSNDWAQGEKLYWTGSLLTTTVGANTPAGIAAAAKATSAAVGRVLLIPGM